MYAPHSMKVLQVLSSSDGAATATATAVQTEASFNVGAVCM